MYAQVIAAVVVVLGFPFDAFRIAEPAPSRASGIPRGGSHSPADSLEARRLAANAVQRFLMDWREKWLAAERARLPAHLDRAGHAHCHPPYVVMTDMSVMSANRKFAKCASWLLTDSRPAVDEADVRDAGIALRARQNIQAHRADLLVTLDSLQRQAPGDVFIVGQLVRFMVDEGRIHEAIGIATRCTADPIWCTALRGYALATRGRAAAADSAFEQVTRLMPPAARCEWTDITLLQPLGERGNYRTRSCAVRDSLARHYWWLARPLLLDVPGPHARRVEHYRRKVMVLLHASLPFDEVHDMRPSHGGDAVAEVLLRYGWPTVTAWAGDSVDRNHDPWLVAGDAPLAPPYTTVEYSSGRVRFGAEWPAVLNPFRADTLAWQLRPPPGQHDNNNSGSAWRPVEHMRFPGGAVMQLSAGQTAFFRRPRTLRVLNASETGAALRSASDETSRAMLVASTAPDSVTIVAESPVSNSGRIELNGEISSRPMLMGIESIGTPSHPLTARTRFGAVPPPPLDSLPNGEIAISQPVFFEATNSEVQPRDLAALSRVMLGSTAVAPGGKVGVFWETYGATASDSVRFAVKISRLESIGLLHRIGAVLRLVDLPVANVAVAWEEVKPPAQDAAGSAVQPAVSIATGSIVLDVSSLSRGRYMLEVTATVQGRADAKAGRVLTIR